MVSNSHIRLFVCELAPIGFVNPFCRTSRPMDQLLFRKRRNIAIFSFPDQRLCKVKLRMDFTLLADVRKDVNVCTHNMANNILANSAH